jgi:hypothetical protein
MDYYIYQQIGDGEVTKIATVTNAKTYTVTGLKPKTTYKFSVSAYNGLRESSKTAAITVTTADIPLTGITLTIDKTALEVGGTATITVAVTPVDETSGEPALVSSNTAVATISGKTLTAKGVGTTNISATSGGINANVITVTVYAALITPTNLAASATTTTGTTLTWS